ncbi:MAG: DUF1223 domain-containing protein [Alphaproteobacteria bacterium]|nr:DUF1223 domain-containing protein [Alphaproteobacteria bacterium]
MRPWARSVLPAVLAVVTVIALAGAATGQQVGTPAPTVVELFTSQSCYSCPPAEAFLATLADRPGVLALEFYVDYWDSLVYGRHGRWKDPFSSPEATARQRGYNVAVRGRGDVYTPQTVVDGRYEAVGSARDTILSLIDRSATERRLRVDVAVSVAPAGGYAVGLAGNATTPGAVWLVTFIDRATTRVNAGENYDKTLSSRNIVVARRKVGDWQGSATTLTLDGIRLEAGQGCAVLVQPEGERPILGAALCPAVPAS